MRIRGDYLRNLPILLDQWADDIDRLDIRTQPDDRPEPQTSKPHLIETMDYEFRELNRTYGNA
jgi:hypothetical protein